LKSAAAVAEARELEHQSAQAQWLPTLDADGRYGREGTSSPFTRRSVEAAPGRAAQAGQDRQWRWAGSVGLTARQLLYDGDRLNSDIEAAGLTAQQSKIEQRLNAEDTVFEAVRAHIRLFDARQQVEIQAATLESLRALETLVRRRVEEKAEESASLIQVQGRIARSESSLIGTEAELLSAESDYERVTGVRPGPLSFENGPERSYKSREEALAAAASHPAIQGSALAVDEGEARLKSRESALKPRVFAELSARERSDDNASNGETTVYGAYLTAEWNLFRGGADVKAIEAGVRLVDAAEAQLVGTQRKVFQEIHETWNQLVAAERQTALALAQEESAQQTFRVYQEQYKASRRSLFDLLNITEELAQSKAASRSSKNRLAFLRYRLKGSLAQLAECFPEEAKSSSTPHSAQP
jgi:adhesin transport system outer membrane protein